MACSFTSLIGQNSILVKGRFILEIQNNVIYKTFNSDEADEYIEQNLLIMNLDTKEVDTLIKNTFFIDVDKSIDNEIIITDGRTISIYNINSKENYSVYSQLDDDMPIIDVITNDNDIYFFVQDYDNYRVLFYKMRKNNDVHLLYTFKYNELESPGIISSIDKNYAYIRVGGILYSFNLKSEILNRLTDNYVYTFKLINDTLFCISSNKDIISLELIEKDNNFKRNIIIKNIKYHYTDTFLIFKNVLYIHYSDTKENYKIYNQILAYITKIPLIEHDKLSGYYINDDYFELLYN